MQTSKSYAIFSLFIIFGYIIRGDHIICLRFAFDFSCNCCWASDFQRWFQKKVDSSISS